MILPYLANSEDPNAANCKGLHILLSLKRSLEKGLEIITSDPSIETMDHHKLILSNQKEDFISA